MASIYTRKNSPYYWIKYRGPNGLVQESTGFRVGVGAEVRRARQLEAEKHLEELTREPGRNQETWEWVSDFLKLKSGPSHSLERYLTAWSTLKMFLLERAINGPAQLRREHCFDYVTWRQRPDKKKGKYSARLNTAILELKTLSSIMQEAVIRGYAPGNPCIKLGIKKDKPAKKPVLTPEDCELIRAKICKVKDPKIQNFLHLSFEIARHQGCRLSETRLNPQTDVQIRQLAGPDGKPVKVGTIIFRAKGGREFGTLLHPNLIPLFEKLKADGQQTTWEQPPNCWRQWASITWYRFLKRIGLKAKGATFHSTRVTVVTELAQSNVHLSKAKSYVGHASTTIHEIYQRLRPDDLSDCIRAISSDTHQSS